MFTRLFVQNPTFTNVIAIIAVILGIVSLTRLPIALYPDITPPTIAVSASYPGADAETVAKTVGAPIELQVNGVENMIYMSSTSADDGTYSLTVTFALGTDVEYRHGIAAKPGQQRASRCCRRSYSSKGSRSPNIPPPSCRS